MPALHGPHIQNEPQTYALAPTGLPSSCSTAELTQQGHGQGCPPQSSLTTYLHDPTGSAAAPSRRSTKLGARSSCSIQRGAQQDEARAASAALCRKKIRCQRMGQKQPPSLHCHWGTQPSLSRGVGSTCAPSHTHHGPNKHANSSSKHLPWCSSRSREPKQTLKLPKNIWGINFSSPLHVPPGLRGQELPSAACSWLP